MANHKIPKSVTIIDKRDGTTLTYNAETHSVVNTLWGMIHIQKRRVPHYLRITFGFK